MRTRLFSASSCARFVEVSSAAWSFSMSSLWFGVGAKRARSFIFVSFVMARFSTARSMRAFCRFVSSARMRCVSFASSPFMASMDLRSMTMRALCFFSLSAMSAQYVLLSSLSVSMSSCHMLSLLSCRGHAASPKGTADRAVTPHIMRPSIFAAMSLASTW